MRASASHRVPRASQHGAIFAESSYFGSVQLSPLRAPFLIRSMLAIGTVCAVCVFAVALSGARSRVDVECHSPVSILLATDTTQYPPPCLSGPQAQPPLPTRDGVRYTSHIPISALCGSLLSSTLPSRSRRSDAAYAARSTHRSPDHRWLPVW